MAVPPGLRTARDPDGLVVALCPLDSAAPAIPAWRRLCRDALVENLFFEPDFALSAAGAFGAGIGLLTVGDRPPEDADARLLALWPCRIATRWGLPLPVLMGWTHGFSIFGAPLLDREAAKPGLRALLDAPVRLGLPPRLMMPYLPLDGPLATCLGDVLAERGARRADFWEHERGFLDVTGRDAAGRAGYLGEHLSERKARQLARLGRRLAAPAPLEHETVRAPDRLGEALDDYIRLETAGWKGRAGTAVGQRPAEVAFLHALADAFGAQDRIRIDRLHRDGRSLAASLALETASTLWYLKISHDEAEARNSPGTQLVERVTRALLADPRIEAADSCAPPNFPLIETFWGERRRLAHGLIEAGGGDRLFPLAVALERLRATVSRFRSRHAASVPRPAVARS